MEKPKKHIMQHDHQIGYWLPGSAGIGRFELLTTFGWKLLKRVLAPDILPQDAEFVVEVSHRKGDG